MEPLHGKRSAIYVADGRSSGRPSIKEKPGRAERLRRAAEAEEARKALLDGAEEQDVEQVGQVRPEGRCGRR